MIPSSAGFLSRWKTGVFGLGNLVEMFVPTPVVSAGASSEASSNFPAAAMNDGDRTSLNAGPFDREESGYGPADNLIGKGLWLSKHIQHDPVFRIDTGAGWRGEAFKTSVYETEVKALTNPISEVGGLFAYYPFADTHDDDLPMSGSGGDYDVNTDEGPFTRHGPHRVGSFAAHSSNPPYSWYNHNLGKPGIIVGGDRTAAGMERDQAQVGATQDQATVQDPEPTNLGLQFTINGWVRFTGVGGMVIERAGFGQIAKYANRWWGLTMTCSATAISAVYTGRNNNGFQDWVVWSADPALGGLGKSFTLNDGARHMVTFVLGKVQGGFTVGELYVDGDLVAKTGVFWPWWTDYFPPNPRVYFGGEDPQPLGGDQQHFSIHNYSWLGDEQPDYAPGLVAYNQVKYVWNLGKDGIDHPASAVAPIFTGTTVVGDKLEPDFAGGTKHADGFDEADEGEKYELFATGWTKVPVGDWSPDFWKEVNQLMLAQSGVVPPGVSGKSAKIFTKPQPGVSTYGLVSPVMTPGPNFAGFTFCGYWEHTLDTPITDTGKLVCEVMIHQQGINPGQGHLMIDLWGDDAGVGKGFSIVLHELTHNFHLRTRTRPTTNRDYYDHINGIPIGGSDVDTGVPWAYDTWYNISATIVSLSPLLVRLSVNGTFLTDSPGLTTASLNKVRIWYKGDDRLPPEEFPAFPNPAYDNQYYTYGSIIYYVDDLRVGAGCYVDGGTYERVYELGGFAIGDAEFSFQAENVTITDGPSTYTPYWSFELAYAASAGGPFSALDPVFPNAGKVSSASGVVFNPQGASYVKLIATYHADGAGCKGSAALEMAELKFGDLAQGIVAQTNGADVGRIILYTDPDLGGIQAFWVQTSADGTNYRTIPGAEILRVRAYEKYNGASMTNFFPDGGITVNSSVLPPGTPSPPSVIIVDFKRNYSATTLPETSYVRVLISEADTPDDLARCTEMELYARYDVTSLTQSYEITHQADVRFESVTARTGTFEIRNPRKPDGAFTFRKSMFQRAESGQLALDATVEIAAWQTIEGEPKQLAWLSVDDPGITHDTGMLTLQSRGRHEKLLITKHPSTFRRDIRYEDIVQVMMQLSNIPLGFYALRQNWDTIACFAPTRKAWEELTDIKQAMEDPGIFFNGDGIMRNLLPETPAVLDVLTNSGVFHRFIEHVSTEIAGKPSALHAIAIAVNNIQVLTNQLLFTEVPESAAAAERILEMERPADPNSLWNNFTPLKITRAHARFPKVAETAVGGQVWGTTVQTKSTEELVLAPWAITDDPNRIIKDSISNPYIVSITQARAVANARLAEQKKSLSWATSEWPSSPHIELADIYQTTLADRGVDQVYAIKGVTHTMRIEEGGATCRAGLEFMEYELP